MKKLLLVALLMPISAASAEVLSPFVHPDTVPAASWSAKWIGTASATGAEVDLTGASWLWSAEEGINPVKKAKPGVVHFRKSITLSADEPLVSARAIMSADNHFALSINGQGVGAGDSWENPQVMDITQQLKPGNNVISVRATNDPDEGDVNAAGLIGKVSIVTAGQKTQTCVTDASWQWSTDEKSWKPVDVIGAVGIEPWNKINSAAHAKKQNLWSCYRKEFTLAGKPKTAIARIAVDSKYWLWVNGVMVVREGALKRGPTPTDTYFDEVDLAPYLKQGANTIAILAWYFGKEGFSHKSSGKGGLLFEMVAGKDKIVSDSSWRAISHPSFGDTDAPHPNFRLPESNIRFDAGKNIAGWETPGFAAASWAPAQELGSPDCAPWNRLVKRPVPFWKDYGLKPYANASSLPKISDGKTIKAKIPYNAQITPYFKINAKAGEVIKIQMDNYNGGGEPNVRAEYVTRDGEQSFECYGWMNGHEVEYDIPAGITIVDLQFRETGFDTEFAGTFDCDDDFLNRLRTKAIRTLYITMRDNYMDCPDRERALWWGDAVNELGESFYAFDRRSDFLTRKCILDLVAWQKPDGVLFAPVPTGNWDKDLPLQMLASIGRTGFWTYSFFSGDMGTLNAAYPGMKRYMEIWDMNPDGLVIPRPGSWAWGDWGDHVDMSMLYNAWYYIALQGLRNSALVLEKDSDLPWIDARMKSIEAGFNKTYWTGTEYRSPEYKGQTDDRANALAVVAGLAKPDCYPALIEVLKTQCHSSPYMEKYVLEALCLMDQPELAQERMKKRYAKMVDHPDYTTLWEGWGIGAEGFGGGTTNHAWSGGPLTIMSQYFAGIAPTAPGFSSYSVLPQMGTLKKITAKVATSKGAIALRLSDTKELFSLDLISPSGTKATVGIPVLAGETITDVKANGMVLWKAGTANGSSAGVRFIEANSRYLVFAVAPGTWSFSANKIVK